MQNIPGGIQNQFLEGRVGSAWSFTCVRGDEPVYHYFTYPARQNWRESICLISQSFWSGRVSHTVDLMCKVFLTLKTEVMYIHMYEN